MTEETKIYWNKRYLTTNFGSGGGSIGKSQEWKWNVIKEYLSEDLNDIIDVGCGDLQFIEGQQIRKYLGIDFSEAIVNKNKELYTDYQFILSPADTYLDISAKTVFCLDMLFHIMAEEQLIKILENLTRYSEKWIVIYTWYKNPFQSFPFAKKHIRNRNFKKAVQSFLGKITTDNDYQTYHDFQKYFYLFEEKNFELILFKKAPRIINPWGAFYIFKKQYSEIKNAVIKDRKKWN